MARKASRKTKGTRQSTMNKRRKGVLAVVMPWMRRFGVALVVGVGVIWLASWLYLSGTASRAGYWVENQMLQASADMGFAVENILVKGRDYSDASVLMAIVNIKKGDPLFAFNPHEAQDLISQISWVENVQVERRWPDTIYIKIDERTPIALWQGDNKLRLLDTHGEVIQTSGLERFADLVIVMGEGAPRAATALLPIIQAEPDIASRVEFAKYISERRWDLILKNKINVALPEEDVGLAVKRLAEEHAKSGIMDKDIQGIDMRESDRISIRTKPGTVQEYVSHKKTEHIPASASGSNI